MFIYIFRLYALKKKKKKEEEKEKWKLYSNVLSNRESSSKNVDFRVKRYLNKK